MANAIPDEYLTPGGSIKPIFISETGDLAVPEAIGKAMLLGYACANCLEYRRFAGMALPKCPTCGAGTAMVETTDPWWT